MVCGQPLRIPGTLAVGCEANTICIIVLKWYLSFYTVQTFALKQPGSNCWCLSMNQGSGTKLDSGSHGFQAVMYPERKIGPMNVLREAVKTINFIKSPFFEGLFDLGGELTTFIYLFRGSIVFTWRDGWQNVVIQNLGVWQTLSWKWIKQVCYFKENNGQYLLPVIKIELWSEKSVIWKTCICPLELDGFLVFKTSCEFGNDKMLLF